MNHESFNIRYCVIFVIGLAPDGQSTNFQRNPVTSMMPYITGILKEIIIYSLMVIIRSIYIINILLRHIYNGYSVRDKINAKFYNRKEVQL